MTANTASEGTPGSRSATGISEIVGVYHADGGVVGESKYFFGKFLGLSHCSLCDITHSPVRRKPDWDRMVQRLGVPVTLLHRNELSPDLVDSVTEYGTPVIMARRDDGEILPLLTSDELDNLSGSVESFESLLTAALARQAAAREAPTPARQTPQH